MSDNSDQPLVTKKGIATDIALSVLFFYSWEVLVPHVPSQDPTAVLIVSSMTTFCMTGVFWNAANMLRVTWVDYNRGKKN